jgi:hypothetical protein
VHPSAIKDEHFTAAEDILLWAGATSRDAARAHIESESDRANLPVALAARIDQEETLWSQWVDMFRASAQTIHQEFNTTAVAPIPDWPVIKDILLAEVILGTRVSVINSDPDADDRPEYEPVQNDDRSWSAGRDVSTIYVSGNVMSRGRSASRQDARETGSVPQLGMPAKPGGDSAGLDPDAASDVGQG